MDYLCQSGTLHRAGEVQGSEVVLSLFRLTCGRDGSGIDKEIGGYGHGGIREQPKNKEGDYVEDDGNDPYSLDPGEGVSSTLRSCGASG